MSAWFGTSVHEGNGVESQTGLDFFQPRVNKTTYGLHSLRYRGPKVWNALPASTKQSENIPSLMSKLTSYRGVPCKCSNPLLVIFSLFMCVCVYVYVYTCHVYMSHVLYYICCFYVGLVQASV